MKQSGLELVHRYDFHEGWELTPHQHKTAELTFVVEGKGQFYSPGGKSFPLESGSLALISPWEIHGCISASPLSKMVITINLDLASDYIRNTYTTLIGNQPIRVLKLNSVQGNHYRKIFSGLVRESLSFSMVKQDALRIGLESLLLLLIRSEPTEGVNMNVFNCIQEVAKEMEDHFHSEYRIQSIPEKYFISESYFRHKFKEVMGLSPKQYLINIRLYKAEQLLSSAPLNVSRITEETGFSSIHQFHSLFVKKHGLTPASWRQLFAQKPGK